ncbi:MAG: hypothetical protein ACRDVG_15300, partial [Jatrophihabitantaceae bacterium]
MQGEIALQAGGADVPTAGVSAPLGQAHDEAQSIIADAMEQAALVLSTAEHNAELVYWVADLYGLHTMDAYQLCAQVAQVP